MDKVVFDASLADWLCFECLQNHSKVTCSISLEKVSSERQPGNAQERNMDYIDISSSTQHDKAESSESSEIPECQTSNSYQNGKDVDMAATFLSSQESGYTCNLHSRLSLYTTYCYTSLQNFVQEMTFSPKASIWSRMIFRHPLVLIMSYHIQVTCLRHKKRE
jgi:hypothetical protein